MEPLPLPGYESIPQATPVVKDIRLVDIVNEALNREVMSVKGIMTSGLLGTIITILILRAIRRSSSPS